MDYENGLSSYSEKLNELSAIPMDEFEAEKEGALEYTDYAKGIYNRLPLILGYLLDIDTALWSLLMPWEVNFNKSWNTFLSIEIWIHNHNIIQTLTTFQCKFHHFMVLF